MNSISRRIEKVEAAIAGIGIPKEEQMQIVKGYMKEGKFFPYDPDDSVEKREKSLIAQYGNADSVLFVEITDRWL